MAEERLTVQRPCFPARRNKGGAAQVLISTAAVFLILSVGQYAAAHILARAFWFSVRERQFLRREEMLSAFELFARGDLCLLGSLFLTVITTVLCLLYAGLIEKRGPGSMGLSLRGMPGAFGRGALAGFGMISAAVLLAWMGGGLRFGGICAPFPAMLLLFFLGFLVQGMSEEVLLRGFYLSSVRKSVPAPAAVLMNSVVFAALHLRNPGISAAAFCNLVLVGIFFSLLTLGSGSLWGAVAAHGVWNFAQGNFYGILVSGLSVRTTVFAFLPVDGMEWLCGGAFGLEGGAVASAVLLAAILLVWRHYQKRGWAEPVFSEQRRRA